MPCTVAPITRGPHKGRWSWRLDVPPASRLAKNAATPKQYQRHGIACDEVAARCTAMRQLRVHRKAANDNGPQ
jgi:hypothetical protein